MSSSPELPPGSVVTQPGPLKLVSLTITQQEDLSQGSVIGIDAQWVWTGSPTDTRPLATGGRFEVSGQPRINFDTQQHNFSETSAHHDVVYPYAVNVGANLVFVVSKSNIAITVTVPLNQGFGSGPPGGGELVFGDLDAFVNVVNVSEIGATLEGRIRNKTDKTGDIAVYIEVRDPVTNVSVLNNAPLINQFMPGLGELFSNLIASSLEPAKTYEARVFALDSSHTVPLSPIATEQFTTAPGGGPPPAPSVLDAQAFAAPLAGPSPLTVQFSSTVVGGVPPYAYSWVEVISGEELAVLSSFSHTFVNIGEHVVLLQVTGQAGGSDTAEVRILVDNALPPPPSPGPSVFGLVALPLYMGALAYVWPAEERRKKAFHKVKAIARGTVRASKRELDKATRALVRGVNRR